ncbi:MAG: BolA family transcriptional regulator [Alphaproteobacteria bacterium]|nr:BolA family transcriptional regulator [Alphaproteobacteria bacterium]
MNRAQRIRAALEEAFDPVSLEIVDESHLHAGHAGARPEGETHYAVSVVSPRFVGQGRVARQRAVYSVLEQEFRSGLHALTVRAVTPDETP